MNTIQSSRPGLSKSRSRRLRKKLHIAEFQELGFTYELTWQTFPANAQQHEFLNAWIELLESRNLVLGGGPTSGFICGRRKNPNLSDIAVLHNFLSSWPGVQQAIVGEMVDAWYE